MFIDHIYCKLVESHGRMIKHRLGKLVLEGRNYQHPNFMIDAAPNLAAGVSKKRPINHGLPLARHYRLARDPLNHAAIQDDNVFFERDE